MFLWEGMGSPGRVSRSLTIAAEDLRSLMFHEFRIVDGRWNLRKNPGGTLTKGCEFFMIFLIINITCI